MRTSKTITDLRYPLTLEVAAAYLTRADVNDDFWPVSLPWLHGRLDGTVLVNVFMTISFRSKEDPVCISRNGRYSTLSRRPIYGHRNVSYGGSRAVQTAVQPAR